MLKNFQEYNNYIFDLGGVLLNLDFNLTKLEFKKIIPHLDDDTFLGRENQLAIFSHYEVGKVSSKELIKSFKEHFKTNISDVEFARCWNAMILDFPIERIKFLQKLRSEGKKIYLLSNINQLHEDAVERRYKDLGLKNPFISLFDRLYYSHQIGMRKPNPEIFEYVISENNLQRGETLFIDDSLQHIVSSRRIGLDAFHLEVPNSIEKSIIFNIF
jgi:putative hydrolase of the HAD superfamily